MNEHTTILEHNLERLLKLYGVDEGFYVLALFSWIEGYIQSLGLDLELYDKFYEKLEFVLSTMAPDNKQYRKLLYQLSTGYRVANKVRHEFGELSKGEALSMTNEFINFCEFFHYESRKLDKLIENRSYWDDKINPIEEHKSLYRLRNKNLLLAEENAELKKAIAGNQISYKELEKTKDELRKKSESLLAAERKLERNVNKNDSLRKDNYDLRHEKENIKEELSLLKAKEEYLSYIERFTLYTRSRHDYEQNLMKLTPEQIQASRKIGDYGDYLVRGEAGTGKTLVLLHALLNHAQSSKEQFDFSESGARCLLTYTNSLVRFNRYLAELLSDNEVNFSISTFDEFLDDRLKKIDRTILIDYNYLASLISDDTLPFLNAKELKEELETAVFGRDLTYDAYLYNPASRAGMKRPLSKPQKEAVWKIAESVRAAMRETRRYSKSYSRIVLLHALKKNPDLVKEMSVQRIYIDEVQDLSPVELSLLKILSEEGLVMAGDDKQAIYQSNFSFKQLGVNIAGHTTNLLMNYRNTRQIYHLSEQYRQAVLSNEIQAHHKKQKFGVFRDGPSPELWRESSVARLIDILASRITFFLDILQYEKENIAVLIPSKTLLETVNGQLQKRGFNTVDIRNKEFSFEESEGIRISTLHSAKGVEFPVVMLFLPDLVISSRIDEKTAHISSRKLLYVAITRCMDTLQILTLQNPENVLVNEFLDVFEKYEEGRKELRY